MKPKIAFIGLSGCGGCEAALLDLGAELTELAARADIVYWPLALDYKKERLENLAEGELEAVWINGTVRTAEQEDRVRLVRRKARRVIAQGTCAHLGGIAGLANLFRKEELLAAVFQTGLLVNNPAGIRPGDRTTGGESPPLPPLKNRVQPLNRIIPVDAVIPGCPPPPALSLRAFSALLDGTLPLQGAVLAAEKALCAYCPRKDSRPERFKWRRPARVHQKIWDPAICFLAAEIPCLGPATRGDCGSRCLQANMPCRGCFGPVEKAGDQGARIIAFLASLLEPAAGEDVEALMKTIPDPTGLAYLYSLAACPLFPEAPEEDDG
ncbi:MAG: oxidoreductase [Deltaproteobacteria bacterium]|nr:oxidoreductase [Deltaproteobacteria bacterium]